MSERAAIGCDLVFIPDLQALVSEPASHFRLVFTDREWRQCQEKPNPLASLAGRWAAKEAVVKAWSHALAPSPSPIDPGDVVWSDIEILGDRHGRPQVFFHGRFRELMEADAGATRDKTERARQVHDKSFQVTISHDGDYASAWAIVQ
ncbi:MAG: holo-ACP synthase [Actinomycetaceae bacterium]|nr:holo-ACP synthase [Actinomycetaceae bacterium]MDU0969589.1 holo-ACP synthase [Actinomycetaceae bacterium]